MPSGQGAEIKNPKVLILTVDSNGRCLACGKIPVGHCHWLECAFARTDRVCVLATYVPERVWFSNLCARKGRVMKCQMCARKGKIL